jgi:hypothetical protein
MKAAALLANIGLGWEWLAVANAHAYHSVDFDRKKFYNTSP